VLGSGLRGVTWWTLAHVVLTLIAGYCLMVFHDHPYPTISRDQYAMFGAMARMPILQTPWLLGLSGFTAGLAALLGSDGISNLAHSRNVTANAVAEETEPSLTPATLPLVAQRCHHHAEREAVARCPECGFFYCRECVTEHDDRVICASCLRKSRWWQGKRRGRFAGLARLLLGVNRDLIAWIFFYSMGTATAANATSFS